MEGVAIMNTMTGKSTSRSRYETSTLAFYMISIIHDNPLLPLFRNPYKLLEVAGLKEGQNVLEVGCGPGYFTIPAAKIVGPKGFVYAIDVNPRAIKRVQKKIEKEGIKNARGILTNAASTGLPDGSINLAFVFGLRYIAGGLQNLMAELHRVLNAGGILSFERTRGSEKELITEVSGLGFTYLSKQGRILSFTNQAQ